MKIDEIQKEKRDCPSDGGNEEQEAVVCAPEGNCFESRAGQMGGYVYFIETHDGTFVKIGFSIDVLKRFDDIRLLLPGLRLLGYMPGTMATECWLHQKFADLRERGEWFRRDERLSSFIEMLGLLIIKPEPEWVRQQPIQAVPSGGIVGPNCKCRRCGNTWVSRVSRPKLCPNCHQTGWDTDTPSKWQDPAERRKRAQKGAAARWGKKAKA